MSMARDGSCRSREADVDVPQSGRPYSAFLLRLTSSTTCRTANSLSRPGTPYAFRAGETARQIVLSLRLSSATTSSSSRGSMSIARHSTDA